MSGKMKQYTASTEKKAVSAAKSFCVSQRPKSTSFSYEKKLKYDKRNWLIRHTNGSCVCGQTPAVEVTLFKDGTQYTSFVNYCNICGE